MSEVLSLYFLHALSLYHAALMQDQDPPKKKGCVQQAIENAGGNLHTCCINRTYNNIWHMATTMQDISLIVVIIYIHDSSLHTRGAYT